MMNGKYVLKMYKWILTVPGQSLTWYTEDFPNNDELSKKVIGYDNDAHGVVKALYIPRDCEVRDLVKCLNGYQVEEIREVVVAKLEDMRWELIEHTPTLEEIVAAVREELRND